MDLFRIVLPLEAAQRPKLARARASKKSPVLIPVAAPRDNRIARWVVVDAALKKDQPVVAAHALPAAPTNAPDQIPSPSCHSST